MKTAQCANPAVMRGQQRAFRWLMAGSSVSMLGSRVTTIAYPMLVLYLTHSPLAAGWVAFAATAPSVFVHIPAGVVIDRLKRPKIVMLLCELGRGFAIGTVVITLVLNRLNVPLLIGVAITEEVLEVFSTLAERRYVRSLLEPEELDSAIVSIEARTHIVVMAGRPLGGFLFGVTPILPFLADALSFAVSAVTILSIKGTKVVARQVNRNTRRWQLYWDIRDGFRWLNRHKYARAAVALSAAATLVSQALIIIILSVAHFHHTPSFEVGAVLAASGLGGVAGTVVSSRLAAPSRASLLQVQMVAWAVAITVLAVSRAQSMPCMALVMAVLGVTGALGNIESSAYVLKNVDEGMVAKVTGIWRLWSIAACASGPVLGGLLTQRLGSETAVWILLALTTLLAVTSVFLPSMRTREVVAAAG